MEITNQQILRGILTIDGIGKKKKREYLQILLERIADHEDMGEARFYIDMLEKEF